MLFLKWTRKIERMGKACQQEDKDTYFHMNIIGIDSVNHKEKCQQQMPLKYLWHRVITNKICNNKTYLYVNISKNLL